MTVVCLSGAPGCGKTTVAAELRKRGFRVVGAGDYMRQRAVELGVDITEMQRQSKADDSLDLMIDLASRDLLIEPGEDVVLDARLGFAFAKQPNLSVRLVCDIGIAGQRVFEAVRNDERYDSAEAAAAALQLRRDLESERYRTLYGISYDDHVFDLTFETVDTPPETIAEIIVRHAAELDSATRLGTIGPFAGEHKFLSNMWPCKVVVDGVEFACSETAYQAQKTMDKSLRKEMAPMDGRTAKMFSQSIDIRPDWECVKWSAMESAVSAKFQQDATLANALMKTAGYALVEFNDWHDGYWGVCTCGDCRSKPAMNMLGRILQVVRAKLLRLRSPAAL